MTGVRGGCENAAHVCAHAGTSAGLAGRSSLFPFRHPQVGYFACDADTVPTYDPPYDGPCLVCWQPLHADDVRTVSLMPLERAVASVFFRVHRTCAESDAQAVEEIEHRIIDGEFAASDEAWL